MIKIKASHVTSFYFIQNLYYIEVSLTSNPSPTFIPPKTFVDATGKV